MTDYRAPLEEINFVINDLLEIQRIALLPGYEEATADLVGAILAEADRFCSEVIAPTNQTADREGCRVENRQVITAPILDGLYEAFRQAGWSSLTGDPRYGGQGLPQLLGIAVDEMYQSANMAFSLLPLLTTGVITALSRHGSEAQKNRYLPKLISGEWSGTMNLTEAQAGSDLAAVRTRAVPKGDHDLIYGQKIFISWGDHSQAANIVHLVLARRQGAPEGIKGISLFVVPKFLDDGHGGLGARNDVYAVSVEHKLGIHASPTCVLNFGDDSGAVGYLIGEENQGLVYMFAMMNHARLGVGLQGVAISERAYQQAAAYAKSRLQGNVSGHPDRVAIIQHPDVRRMLMLMKAQIEAGRALTYSALAHWDFASRSADADARAYHQRRVDLLTPLVKGWCTETANEVTSLGVQIHGGMGFIEETGAAQHLRDARVMAIYEGTNGIQAMDLVGRKLLRDQGEAARELLADLQGTVALCREQHLDAIADAVAQALAACAEGVHALFAGVQQHPDFAGAVAFNLLMLMGTTVGGCLLAKSAALATAKLARNEGNSRFLSAKVTTARFFGEQVLARTEAYLRVVKSGHRATMGLVEEQF
ncbi:MAG: acyl-CoA dehydrogenase [Porticoccaceae bacterium]